jgi:hypothetical protein
MKIQSLKILEQETFPEVRIQLNESELSEMQVMVIGAIIQRVKKARHVIVCFRQFMQPENMRAVIEEVLKVKEIDQVTL